ncbi:MAG: endonuclease [Bacteroidales bacterium]
MISRLYCTAMLCFTVCILAGQIPPGYYDPASGLHGEALQEALYDIIKEHNVETYSQLWDDFQFTDRKANGKVWDMYSDVPGGTPPYQYTFITDQCGNYSQEGDCYNREHTFAKSWFGGEIYPMYSDLFHIYPTDGWVNNKRGNYPFGETGNATWTSLNGSKTGNCNYTGYSDVIFEPVDAYKGDIARSFFYMACRYYGEDNDWPGSDMTSGSQLKPWALDLMHAWHLADPVSTKEIERNEAVYDIQQNRNPFIDHPEFMEMIWFYTQSKENTIPSCPVRVYPNPFQDQMLIELPGNCHAELKLTGMLGRELFSVKIHGKQQIRPELPEGMYFLIITGPDNTILRTEKVIKM